MISVIENCIPAQDLVEEHPGFSSIILVAVLPKARDLAIAWRTELGNCWPATCIGSMVDKGPVCLGIPIETAKGKIVCLYDGVAAPILAAGSSLT